MILGGMQPYLFPYLGYFQLIHAVDTFVIGDDVQYIRKGWINRNRILLNNEPNMFTFATKRVSFKEIINNRYYDGEKIDQTRRKFLSTIHLAYRRAPHFSEIFPLLTEIIEHANLNVAEFNTNSLKRLCGYMDIGTDFVISSHLKKDPDLKAQDAVIDIVKVIGAECFVNPVGGKELYSKTVFQEHGIDLKFIEMNGVEYPQFGNTFVPSLSIIDVLMFNSKDRVRELLDCYTLS